MITCSRLTLGYGDRTVLTDFSAQFKAGTISAILGANGCGKSTLLIALAGDLLPKSGEIALNEKSISEYTMKELSALASSTSKASKSCG